MYTRMCSSVVMLLVLVVGWPGCGNPKGEPGASLSADQKAPTTSPAVVHFANVEMALAHLKDENSPIRWEASEYLSAHPECVAELQRLITAKDSARFIAMCTLTRIGGDAVVDFYVELLGKNFYETDAAGQRVVYGYGTPRGCCSSPFEYGRWIVEQLGQLGNRRAEKVLREAWKDSDPEVRGAVPKALYQVGALGVDELFGLAHEEGPDRKIYFAALCSIAGDLLHERTKVASDILHRLAGDPLVESSIREEAHFSLMRGHESQKQWDQALEECAWIVSHAKSGNLAAQMKHRRLEILYEAGRLSLDDLFAEARKDAEVYDRIAMLARFTGPSGLATQERIIREAPADSKYVMESRYWKIEYYDEQGEWAKGDAEAAVIEKDCKFDYVLTWVKIRTARRAAAK